MCSQTLKFFSRSQLFELVLSLLCTGAGRFILFSVDFHLLTFKQIYFLCFSLKTPFTTGACVVVVGAALKQVSSFEEEK